MPHCFRRGGKEVPPAAEALVADQSQVGLMDQGGGVEGVSGLLRGHPSGRELAQFGVYKWKQLGRGLAVAGRSGLHLLHRHRTPMRWSEAPVDGICQSIKSLLAITAALYVILQFRALGSQDSIVEQGSEPAKLGTSSHCHVRFSNRRISSRIIILTSLLATKTCETFIPSRAAALAPESPSIAVS